MTPGSDRSIELALIAATVAKDKDKIQCIIEKNPGVNIDCYDDDEFTPLQHACHSGEVELVKILLEKGAHINYSARKDLYTPLMLAALGNKIDVVKYLLEKGADKKALNTVNRTAADMAAFVGLGRIATSINCFLTYKETIEPYTRCLELEDKPRLETDEIANKLYQWILLPTLHPIKLLYYILENPEIMRHGNSCIFVIDKLSSKYLKPQTYNDSFSLKFHYLAELLRNCKLVYENSDDYKKSKVFTDAEFQSVTMKYLRRLNTRRYSDEDEQYFRPILNDIVLRCIFSYPHNTATHQSMKYALSKMKSTKMNFDAMVFLAQTLNAVGSLSLGTSNEECEICREADNNKKCANCKRVFYCGPICQKVDWPRHRKGCETSISSGKEHS